MPQAAGRGSKGLHHAARTPRQSSRSFHYHHTTTEPTQGTAWIRNGISECKLQGRISPVDTHLAAGELHKQRAQLRTNQRCLLRSGASHTSWVLHGLVAVRWNGSGGDANPREPLLRRKLGARRVAGDVAHSATLGLPKSFCTLRATVDLRGVCGRIN